jgi:hypothetical protein
MSIDPKNLEKAALDKVNQEKGWIVANKLWLIAILAAAIAGFILGKL